MVEGLRFSLVYIDRSMPLKDSQRFRNRLNAYCSEVLSEVQVIPNIAKSIHREIGVEVLYLGNHFYNISDFFRKKELRDILDSITVIYQVLQGYGNHPNMWKDFVTRVLFEENMGYRLDSLCGVHYYVDEEFARNRFSTLSLLEDQKYMASRAAYEDAYRYMDSHPPDTKAAVRSMFESLEIIVKQMIETQNLNKYVVENSLKKKCITLYKGDETAIKTVAELFDGFAKWVNALHNYRHGQANHEPVAPSESIAIYILSSGSSFLRWLIDMDKNLENRI